MKKIITIMALMFSMNLMADILPGAFFVKTEATVYNNQDYDKLDKDTMKYLLKSVDEKEYGVFAGFEMQVDRDMPHFWMDASIGLKHKGTANSAVFTGHVIYKVNKFSNFYVGGYFGIGRDKSDHNQIYVDAVDATGTKTKVALNYDSTPVFYTSAFELGGNFTVYENLTIDIKLQLDRKNYEFKMKANEGALDGLDYNSLLNILALENASVAMNSDNIVIGINYKF